MADSPSSSDLELEASPPRKQSKRAKKASGTRSGHSSRTSHKDKTVSAQDKDALRRHKALERQCAKAQKSAGTALDSEGHPTQPSTAKGDESGRAGPSSLPPVPAPAASGHPLLRSKGVSLSLPDVSVAGSSSSLRRIPEATFTPTAAGLRATEATLQVPQLDLQTIFSSALSSLLAAGLNQAAQIPLQTQTVQEVQDQVSSQTHTSCRQADSSEDSDQAEECPEDIEFSDDEGLLPDAPAFTGLFRPALFKSLLHKARLTTNLGIPGDITPESQTKVGPHDALFNVAKPDKDFIPCPQLFSEVIQTPCSQPGSLTTPSSQDKKLYCSAPELEDILALPTVDQPVASLSSASLVSTDSLDGLKAEDRRSELAFRKSHQAVAWAIRTATATSFFNRASLIWLRQLQERLPPENTRLHQDINKIVAATEYSADASLNSVKFASRALASTVTSRRLFWLRHWKADLKAKWKLAASPYKAPNLFGEALDPLLIEDKDKRKVLPSSSRRPERRYTPYSHRQPFRSSSGPSGSSSQRSQFQSGDRYQDRQQFRDRGRNQQSGKRQFRGTGYKPFRRGK